MDAVADRIRTLRREWHLTQPAFGSLAGVSKQAVSQWEAGETEPSWDALINLQQARGINPRWILSGIEPMFLNQINDEGTPDWPSAPEPPSSIGEALRPEPTMADLLDLLAARLASADPALREEVSRLVLRYLDHPEARPRILRAIEGLLGSENDSDAS